MATQVPSRISRSWKLARYKMASLHQSHLYSALCYTRYYDGDYFKSSALNQCRPCFHIIFLILLFPFICSYQHSLLNRLILFFHRIIYTFKQVKSLISPKRFIIKTSEWRPFSDYITLIRSIYIGIDKKHSWLVKQNAVYAFFYLFVGYQIP